MMPLDSRSLQVFRSVAESGSLSAAATHLHTVQSNVTAHIKRLEQGLGQPLLYRKPRGVELTPAGEVLLAYALRIARLLEAAVADVGNTGDSSGPLRIGTLETLAAARLPSALAGFRRAFPRIDLQLTTGSTEYLAEQVLGYQIDGAFVAGAVEHPDIDYQALHEEELVLVSETQRTEVKNLSDEVLLVFRRGCAFRKRAEQWLDAEGLIPQRTMEFGALDAILGCVAAGMGVTLLPRVVVERPHYESQVRLHAIPKHHARMPTGFIRRHDVTESRAMAALIAGVLKPTSD